MTTDNDERQSAAIEHSPGDSDRIVRLKRKQGVTTSYEVHVTLERGSKHIWAGRYVKYCTPQPTSEEEAIELAKEEYDNEIENIRSVETAEVPAPAKWPDDDPRIRPFDSAAEGGDSA